VTILLGLCNPPRSQTDTLGPSLPSLTIAPCVDSLLCYRLIRRPKSILQDSPKIWGTCMHLYNYIWFVILVSRLNLAFLSPKLSRGIDKVLVYLCPCGFEYPRNTLRWKLLQLESVCLRIILLGLRTANTLLPCYLATSDGSTLLTSRFDPHSQRVGCCAVWMAKKLRHTTRRALSRAWVLRGHLIFPLWYNSEVPKHSRCSIDLWWAGTEIAFPHHRSWILPCFVAHDG
jgi:hypothetical protein